ncbi:Box C/D snoRNA protein 1, partial [Operophtera brumata]
INWRIEWIFPNVDEKPLKFVDEKIPENKKLSTLLDKYLNPDALPFEGSKALGYYRAAGYRGVKVLLRAEKVKSSAKKFFELDPTESLAENLSGKCIVEFPIIFVVLKDHAYNFEIITPEDEFDYQNERSSTVKEENQPTVANGGSGQPEGHYSQQNRKRPKQLMTEKIAIQKKLEIQKEIKAERKKRPKNLLFTTGYSSEESLSGCDSDKDAG